MGRRSAGSRRSKKTAANQLRNNCGRFGDNSESSEDDLDFDFLVYDENNEEIDKFFRNGLKLPTLRKVARIQGTVEYLYGGGGGGRERK